jgi:hypothetical protein
MKKSNNSIYLQLIVNCKDESAKQSILAELMKDERVDSVQLGEGGTVVYVASFSVGTYCHLNASGSQNLFIGKKTGYDN